MKIRSGLPIINKISSTARTGPLSSDIWSELRVFLAVGQLGSFAKAAESIGLSTPTVSRCVRRLQDVLGTQLVIPGISGAVLTKEGIALLESLDRLDFEIHEIMLQLKRAKTKLDGIVRLGAIEGLVGSFVTPALANFHDRFPSINIIVKANDGLDGIYTNECDLTLTFEKSTRTDVSTVFLGHIHLVPVASKGYIEKYGLPNRYNLREHHFISFTNYQKAGTNVDTSERWKQAMSEAKLVGVFESRLAYNLAASSGLGIAFVGSYSLNDKDLVLLDLVEPISFPIYLAAIKARLVKRHMKLTAEWLTRLFQENQQWFGGGDETLAKAI